jgi:hypothetical protein
MIDNVELRPQYNLIKNGDFESVGLFCKSTSKCPLNYNTSATSDLMGIYPWTVSIGVDEMYNETYPVQTGNWSIDLNGDGPGGISQQVQTIANEVYIVYYWIKARTSNGVKTGHLSASGSIGKGFSAVCCEWVQDYYIFTALYSTTTITFASTTKGNSGPYIDNIELYFLPLNFNKTGYKYASHCPSLASTNSLTKALSTTITKSSLGFYSARSQKLNAISLQTQLIHNKIPILTSKNSTRYYLTSQLDASSAAENFIINLNFSSIKEETDMKYRNMKGLKVLFSSRILPNDNRLIFFSVIMVGVAFGALLKVATMLLKVINRSHTLSYKLLFSCMIMVC